MRPKPLVGGSSFIAHPQAMKIFKEKPGIASVTWDDVVIESLWWGWIDRIEKSIDDEVYLRRITPRKACSS